MIAKVVLLICAPALMVQSIAGQCCSSWSAAPCGSGPQASSGLSLSSLSQGGGLAVTSASASAPSGFSVLSENTFEGSLPVCGALPFLGTVGLEGYLPTAGAGAVAYRCGNGEVAILSENRGAADVAGPAGCGCRRAAYY